MPELIVGPVLRYVDATRATVWVQTDVPCEVEVLGHRARTFTVDGHHFALLAVTGLSPGTRTEYGVTLDGESVWPPAEHPFPPSVIPTGGGGGRLRLAFGSCREVAPHEPPYTLEEDEHPQGHGIDALRSLAVTLAGDPDGEWPDALLMLGDQLYADEPPRRLVPVLNRRDQRPNGEVRADSFGDYALLYREGWTEPAVRWLLSTLPSMMIFDDHEIVDEWKISQAWIDERRDDPRYRQRVEAGLAAYWVFQHLGNLSPDELAGDEVVRQVHEADDAWPTLRDFARQADEQVGQSRWSFCRDLGRVRLLVLDSRAARRLRPGERRILDDAEWEWAVARATEAADVDHLIVASSLPMLLPTGLHDLEAVLELLGDGARGRRAARVAEWMRRALNLGHWASFQSSFRDLTELLGRVAGGRAEIRPASIVLLSGDVHHGYLARFAARAVGSAVPVWQVVCSPFRKHLAGYERFGMRASQTRTAARVGTLLARAAGVVPAGSRWEVCTRPSYDNQIALLEFDGRDASVRLETPAGSDWRAPQLRTVWNRELT